jgi:hypothetical protein
MAAAIEANTQATVEATELLGRSISDVHASIEGEAIRSLIRPRRPHDEPGRAILSGNPAVAGKNA